MRGIVHREDAPDPGRHPRQRPRTLLGERLNDLVRTTWAEVDVVAVRLPGEREGRAGDRFIVTEPAVRRTPRVAVATKTDLASPSGSGSTVRHRRAGPRDRH